MHELLKNKPPRTVKYTVVMDDEKAAQLEKLESQIIKLRRDRGQSAKGTINGLQKRADDLRAELRESSVDIVLSSVGRRKFDDLISDHPITPEQKKEMIEAGVEEKDVPSWNPETFPPALLKMSVTEPEDLSDTDIQAIWDDWNQSESGTLFQLAMMVNTQRRIVDLGN